MHKGILVALLTVWALRAVLGMASPASASGAQDDATAAAHQAKAALSAAEVAVRAAAEQRALWTTARDALAQARAALERGDYSAARRWADFAADQARLGIAQTGYRQFQ